MSGTEARAAGGAVHAFFAGLNVQFPANLLLRFDPLVNLYNDVDNSLAGDVVMTGTALTDITGADSGPYAAGVGGRVDWQTGVISRGRRVQGATFLVPFSGASFTTSGNLTTSCLGLMDDAVGGLFSTAAGGGVTFGVYARALPASTHHAARVGLFCDALTGSPDTQGAQLRRRRD